jgi:hypothetical protein
MDKMTKYFDENLVDGHNFFSKKNVKSFVDAGVYYESSSFALAAAFIPKSLSKDHPLSKLFKN